MFAQLGEAQVKTTYRKGFQTEGKPAMRQVRALEDSRLHRLIKIE
jgi:hypothetical protein